MVDKCRVEVTSDHAVLSFCINHLITHRQCEPRRKVYIYKRANFDTIRSELRESNLLNVVDRSNDVNTAWSNWYSTVSSIIDRHVPKVSLKKNCVSLWFDSELKHISNKKQTAFRKAKLSYAKSHWKKI